MSKKAKGYICDQCHEDVGTTYYFKKKWLCEECLKKAEKADKLNKEEE